MYDSKNRHSSALWTLLMMLMMMLIIPDVGNRQCMLPKMGMVPLCGHMPLQKVTAASSGTHTHTLVRRAGV